MGLKGDGHGDYYDNQGNLRAKTVDGELKIFTGREAKKEEPAAQKAPKQQAAKRPAPAAKVEPQPMRASGVVVVFGRFNPPTVGHEKLLKAAATEAKREVHQNLRFILLGLRMRRRILWIRKQKSIS